MKKVLILGSECFDKADATGIIARNIYNQLSKTTDCYLLGYSKSQDTHNIYIYIYNDKEICFKYKKRLKNKTLKKIETLKRCFIPIVDVKLVTDYYNRAEKLIKENNINNILAFYFPLEALIVAYKLKKKYKNINVIDYEFDSAIDTSVMSSRLSSYRIKAYISYLKKIYHKLDKIMILDSHYKKFVNTFGFSEKFTKAYLPSLEDEIKYKKENNSKTVFLYAGSLNLGSYSPESALDLFNNNRNKKNWELHFYSRGTCEELLKEASNNDFRIFCHGYINKNELYEKIGQADFLLSFEHKEKLNNPNFKLFTYFSFSKPIIHFKFTNVANINDEYLDKYKLHLTVSKSTNNQNILTFIKNNKGKTANYKKTLQLFDNYTIPKVCKSLYDLLI